MNLWGKQRGDGKELLGKEKGEQSLAELHFLEQKLNMGAGVTFRDVGQHRWKLG